MEADGLPMEGERNPSAYDIMCVPSRGAAESNGVDCEVEGGGVAGAGAVGTVGGICRH